MPLMPGSYEPKIYYSQNETSGGFERPSKDIKGQDTPVFPSRTNPDSLRNLSFRENDPRSWTAREWHGYFQGLDSKSDGYTARDYLKTFA